MERAGKNTDGFDRTGRRGDAYLAAREAGWPENEIAAKFGISKSAVAAAVKRAERMAANRSPKKVNRPAG